MYKSGQEGLIGPGSNDYGRTKTSNFFSQKNTGGLSDQEMLDALHQAKSKVQEPYKPDNRENNPPNKSHSWEVTEFIGNSSEPKTITRIHDGESFTIGDYVTNGTKMKGCIEKFEYSFKTDQVFVFTDWSGIGMNLNSLQHTMKLPSAHQIGHKVWLRFGDEATLKDCEVIKVHFSESKVLYDVEVSGMYDKAYQKKGEPQKWATRLYNVDSCFVTALTN